MTIATTPAALPLPSHRMSHLRHELARLSDLRDRYEAAMFAAIDGEFYADDERERGREDRAGDLWSAKLTRVERELAAVRRAIRAAVASRYGEVRA